MRILRKKITIFCVILFIVLSAVFILEADEKLTSLFKSAEPSVVIIATFDKNNQNIGIGSGFFVNYRGDVITNWHVIEKAHSIFVRTSGNKIYQVVKIRDVDKDWDLACLGIQLEDNRVQPLSVSSDIPQVGENIAVIGAPHGLEKTISQGIVSACREKKGVGRIMQIDAPLASGSSGSPVLNMKGKVVGIVSFQFAGERFLNFAIPGERILKLSNRIGAKVTREAQTEPSPAITTTQPQKVNPKIENTTPTSTSTEMHNIYTPEKKWGTVTAISGSYLTVECENMADIKIGIKAVIYGNNNRPIGEGYVTTIYTRKCILELQTLFGTAFPTVGMIVKF